MNTFSLKIITPDGEFYSGEVEYVSAYTTDGMLGIMRGALPRIVVLCHGKLGIKTSVIDVTANVGNGIIEIDSDSSVTVITESCAYGDEIANDKVVDTGDADISARAFKNAKAKIAASLKNMGERNFDN